GYICNREGQVISGLYTLGSTQKRATLRVSCRSRTAWTGCRSRRPPPRLGPCVILVALFAGDVVLDGVEAVFGPVLIATLLLPYLAPDAVVQQIRAERARPV